MAIGKSSEYSKRSYAAGRFAVFVGDEACGFVKSVNGGTVKGEISVHNGGAYNEQKKHISTITYDEITLEIGMGMGKALQQWMQNSFDSAHVVKDGAIVAADFDYNAMRRTDFFGGLITEIGFPALDGSSKEAGYMTVKIKPERLRNVMENGEKIQGKLGVKTKKWRTSNFAVSIGSLPCEYVNKVDAITIKQKFVEDRVGAFRDPTIHATSLEIPNLKLTISNRDIKEWAEWHQSFVIDGNSTDADELNGEITFLTPDGLFSDPKVLGRIELFHLGIISLEQAKHEANKEDVARFVVELYCEKMKFEFIDVDA